MSIQLTLVNAQSSRLFCILCSSCSAGLSMYCGALCVSAGSPFFTCSWSALPMFCCMRARVHTSDMWNFSISNIQLYCIKCSCISSLSTVNIVWYQILLYCIASSAVVLYCNNCSCIEWYQLQLYCIKYYCIKYCCIILHQMQFYSIVTQSRTLISSCIDCQIVNKWSCLFYFPLFLSGLRFK